MPIPNTGGVSFSQLAAELGNACSNVSLRSYSSCGNLSQPDSLSELRGCQCTPVYGTGSWSTGSNITTSKRLLAGAGTQSEGLAAGGLGGTSATEEYIKPLLEKCFG